MKRFIFIFSIFCFLLHLVACDNVKYQGHRLEKTLHEQQVRAELLTDGLSQALQYNNFDSLLYYTQDEKQILFYIYDGNRLVYWSDIWLSAPVLPMENTYDDWSYTLWSNAQGIYKRTKAGKYDILTVIPIKYNYRVTSELLTNSFIEPFEGEQSWDITLRKGKKGYTYPIHSIDGQYLFSLRGDITGKSSQSSVEIQNFSYQSILASEKHSDDDSRNHLFIYYTISALLFIVLSLIAIVSLIRNQGLRKMRLAGKLQLLLISVVMISLASIFLLSVVHIREVFLKRQERTLQEKATYVQTALEMLYFWDMQLTTSNTPALNVDLRDMSFAYETDIHVYDLNGRLIGSSAPQIFDMGLLSQQMSPEAFFADNAKGVFHEQIGNVRYLCAYTDFINGSYMPIGYIAIPSFISEEEMNADVENFIGRLLPLYIALLLLFIIVVWIIARMVTAPLSELSDELKNYRLGERASHVHYAYQDEVGDLVQRYNQMMDALAESTDKLAKSEREGAWRVMARQVAHEINNPLTPMRLTLQQLRRLKGTERFDKYFEESTQLLIEQIDNLGNIAGSFSSFAKMPEVEPSEVDIAVKLSSFIVLMKNNDGSVPIRYVGPDHGVIVYADPVQITQVFTNIVRNAIQAMQGRENSDIIIIMKSIPDNMLHKYGLDINKQWIEISFSDNGPGIPQEAQEKVFVPNFTTKNTGAGLGLPISKNIVEGSGGRISFQTSDKGTTFFVYLQRRN